MQQRLSPILLVSDTARQTLRFTHHHINPVKNAAAAIPIANTFPLPPSTLTAAESGTAVGPSTTLGVADTDAVGVALPPATPPTALFNVSLAPSKSTTPVPIGKMVNTAAPSFKSSRIAVTVGNGIGLPSRPMIDCGSSMFGWYLSTRLASAAVLVGAARMADSMSGREGPSVGIAAKAEEMSGIGTQTAERVHSSEAAQQVTMAEGRDVNRENCVDGWYEETYSHISYLCHSLQNPPLGPRAGEAAVAARIRRWVSALFWS